MKSTARIELAVLALSGLPRLGSGADERGVGRDDELADQVVDRSPLDHRGGDAHEPLVCRIDGDDPVAAKEQGRDWDGVERDPPRAAVYLVAGGGTAPN